MGFLILILTIIIYLIRPAEWIPALHFNWNMLLNIFGIILIIVFALNQKRKFIYDKTTLFLIWFILAMMLSNVFNGQYQSIGTYFFQMLSTLIIFVLTQNSITKSKQIDNLIVIIIGVIIFICYQCHLQATIGLNWGGLEPLSRGTGGIDPETGKSVSREIQVIWYGILQDPNDLGMLLVAFMPYIMNRIFYQKLSFSKKIFWLLCFITIGYTVILTNSRGSMLALMGSLAFFYIIKKRSVSGFVLALTLSLILLMLAPSRMGELGSGDHSAMGRIFAWILGLELLASKPLFGIGAMQFLNYHGLTTHNSYVLAVTETGLIGFIGYFSLLIISVRTAIKIAYKLESTETTRSIEIISLASGMIGIMISIFFISRTYVLIPFLYIAIMMTYLTVNTPSLHKEIIKTIKLKSLVMYSLGFVVFIYSFNRLATTLLI